MTCLTVVALTTCKSHQLLSCAAIASSANCCRLQHGRLFGYITAEGLLYVHVGDGVLPRCSELYAVHEVCTGGDQMIMRDAVIA